MTQKRPASTRGRIRKSGLYWGSQLDDQLLHDKDGSSRFGSLKQICRNRKKLWVADGKVYERARDGNYWIEVSQIQRGIEGESTSVRTVSGGAPGLGKKS